jgi:hypothetical protein
MDQEARGWQNQTGGSQAAKRSRLRVLGSIIDEEGGE